MWTRELIKFWAANYYSLRNYELNPFSSVHHFQGDLFISGEGKNAPYIETCDLNWEFDKALKKLGVDEMEFRRLYLDGEGKNEGLFNKLLKLLEGENESRPERDSH